MNRIVHFEIPVEDASRASAFYSSVFGWKFTQWGNEEYWMVETGDKEKPGIDGGLLKRRNPMQPVTNTIDVENIADTISTIKKNGGEIVLETMPVPTVGWLAYFKDTEGNIHGIMQMDPEAK